MKYLDCLKSRVGKLSLKDKIAKAISQGFSQGWERVFTGTIKIPSTCTKPIRVKHRPSGISELEDALRPVLLELEETASINGFAEDEIQEIQAISCSSPGFPWLESSKPIGDRTCIYNAQSSRLRCAVNPSGPCGDCQHYEVKK